MTGICEHCSFPCSFHRAQPDDRLRLGICEEFRSTHRRRYYIYALGLWAVIVAITVGLSYAFPPLQTSVLSLVSSFLGSGDYNQSTGSILGGWPLYVFGIFILLTLGKKERIYRYARREEVQYRRGAEHWSWKRRGWSCLRFGLAHFWNIVVPFALVIGLSVAGVYLMAIYLHRYRESGSVSVALAAATHAHVAYNRIVLGFLAFALTIVVASSL